MTLRQFSLRPGLVPKDYLEQLKARRDSDNKTNPQIALTAADRSRQESQLLQAIEDLDECPVCSSNFQVNEPFDKLISIHS